MTPELSACFEAQDGAEALRLMRGRQFRHLVVLSRDRRLVGIVSLQDMVVSSAEPPLAGSAMRWPL